MSINNENSKSVFDEAMNVVQGIQQPDQQHGKSIAVKHPDALLPGLESVGRSLPLCGMAKKQKRRVFQGYNDCQEMLAEMYEDGADFLTDIIKCNTQWESPQKATEVDDTTVRNALFSHQHPANQLAFSGGGAATAEIATLPLQKISELLIQTIRDQCVSLLNGMNEQLAYLSAIEQVGLIEWLSKDVCRFSFFQNVIRDRKLNTSSRSEVVGRERHTKTRNTYDRTLEHTKIVHDVIDAQKHPIPAKHVVMPERVVELVDATPAWLAPLADIVTGFEISEERTSQSAVLDQWSETTTNVERLPVQRRERTRRDPAFVIGPYVLTGWN